MPHGYCCCCLFPPSRSCQRLAHELHYYNLDAPQLDERLRPAEPEHRLVLVGGRSDLGNTDDCSKWIQCFHHKAGGWGRLGDMAVWRPQRCGAAAVGDYLYAFGGEGDAVVQPGCMTMYNMATRKVWKVAKPPRALQLYCCGLWWPGVQPGGLGFACAARCRE